MRLPILVLLFVLALPSSPAQAQEYVWSRSSGPDGGDCRAVAFTPGNTTRVLAGFYRGVHLSVDGGAQWAPVQGASYCAQHFAFDPANNQIVYAATNGAALQKSVNGGASWTTIKVTPTDPQPALLCVTVDPTNSSRIYAGAESKGAYRTTNGGASWTQINTGMGNASIRTILINPNNPSHLVAGGSGGVFVSTDGGDTWTASNAGLGNSDVRELAALPGFEIFFAATMGGVYKSVDACANWTFSSSGLTELGVNSLAVDPSDANVLYVGTKSGVFRSTDAGTSWQPRSDGLEKQNHVQVIEIDPSDSRRLIAGTGGSVFRSTNGGQSWTLSATGVYGMRCQALAATPARPGRIIVGCGTGIYGAGVYRSDDWGASWELIGVGNEYVDTVACSWANADFAFAASGNGIFRTQDGGTSWDRTQQTGRMYGFCADTGNPLRFYGGSNGSAVWRTLDAGDSWSQCSSGITNPLVRSIAIDSARPARLYAGVDAGYSMPGVFHTFDGGDSWSPAESGVIGQRIWALAVDPTDGTVYAGSYSGLLFKSTDGGVNFTQSANLGSTIACIAVDPVNRHVYVGTTAGVHRSTNLGSSFARLSGYNQLALALLVDPNNHNFLYVGSDGDRVWRYTFRADAATVADAKSYPDSQLVRLSEKTVTAVFAGRFYVQDEDRTAGIAVVSTASVTEGEVVTVTGTLRTVNGEREIEAAAVE